MIIRRTSFRVFGVVPMTSRWWGCQRRQRRAVRLRIWASIAWNTFSIWASNQVACTEATGYTPFYTHIIYGSASRRTSGATLLIFLVGIAMLLIAFIGHNMTILVPLRLTATAVFGHAGCSRDSWTSSGSARVCNAYGGHYSRWTFWWAMGRQSWHDVCCAWRWCWIDYIYSTVYVSITFLSRSISGFQNSVKGTYIGYRPGVAPKEKKNEGRLLRLLLIIFDLFGSKQEIHVNNEKASLNDIICVACWLKLWNWKCRKELNNLALTMRTQNSMFLIGLNLYYDNVLEK